MLISTLVYALCWKRRRSATESTRFRTLRNIACGCATFQKLWIQVFERQIVLSFPLADCRDQRFFGVGPKALPELGKGMKAFLLFKTAMMANPVHCLALAVFDINPSESR